MFTAQYTVFKHMLVNMVIMQFFCFFFVEPGAFSSFLGCFVFNLKQPDKLLFYFLSINTSAVPGPQSN
uniref:Uncharacterized protein n=1 Tax=Anguilla anguilla TaxID=7936 RepID=A0A0E9Q320_ANGAN